MGNGSRQPNFDPHSKTYNPGWRHHPNFGCGGQVNQGNQFNNGNQFNQRQFNNNNNFQQQRPPLAQPQAPKQPSSLEEALQKLTLSTATFVDGTTSFMNETKATLKNQEASIRNSERKRKKQTQRLLTLKKAPRKSNKKKFTFLLLKSPRNRSQSSLMFPKCLFLKD
ncbi:hypothetical protein PIB30_082788 [Stylosanthes scabra]|uniref:Uncharacterized protein n=1 Tax=Stylosanthes scabra TaxID=79078 RepID=A0ABU6ZQN7_9FABA|nr:hypothetical protein [Stylosanthes scabra]